MKDVSALANTVGGDLIYGIATSKGVITDIPGVKVNSADDEMLRLDSLMQAGIEPSLVGTRMRAVALSNGNHVIVVRVRPSWNPPHRAIYKGTKRFYGRNSTQAYELTVEQLRAVFTGAVDAERRITDFRLQRLARLKSKIGPHLTGPGAIVLHVVPVNAPTVPLDVSGLVTAGQAFAPMAPLGYNNRVNFDGIAFETAGGEGLEHAAMTQVFRDGRIEAGRGKMTFRRPDHERVLSYGDAVPNLLQAVERYVKALHERGVAAPFAIMVSLIDMGGTVMMDHDHWYSGASSADRDDFLFELVILDDVSFGEGWQVSMRPMLDQWWNAFGRNRCFHLFDEAGAWKGYPQNWRV